ncbi:tRNA lysidine(34) synthetase TilS [Propionivibrio sp.]|uniref:tRNA lysidine(34) synthetase TilS n=1 Tax=Propionivibrio sp. TaxID=2212460 RepID=UPI0025CBEBFE|nr:tRNA lysidine(34) synthetase TilS [Propionivibrio sp.]
MAESGSAPVSPAAHPFASELEAFLLPRLKQGDRLCVGVSGGRDSVVLLHALSRLAPSFEVPIRLSAVHVYHGLSPNADAWADFCADFCQRCGVPLEIVRVDVPRDSGEGLEAAARRMRHGVFAARAADWLALAHHRDDQAETVLLNLLRGAGIAGAAGMSPERPQARGPALIRPLLDVPRSAIEAYADTQGLRWIDDESNADVHFRRNFLRREIIPRLEEKFPGTQRSLARAAGHFAEGAELLNELAAIDRVAVLTPAGRLGLAAFNALPAARARNLLRHEWLGAGFRAPDTRWIDEARHQLASTDALSETCLKTPEGELRVYRGEIYVARHRPDTSDAVVHWRGEDELPWAGGRVRFVVVDGGGIRRTLLESGEVFIRARQGGERLQAHPARPRRSLRNLLQEASIPAWERNYLPYLWCGDRLAWVAGLGVDVKFACAAGEAGVLPVWEPD